MLNILHCADLHLEACFASTHLPPSVGAARREGLRDALARIAALARERQVDALTIGGDLYEQAHATPDLGEFLRRQFADLAPIQVFITPGDSDPYSEDSLYALAPWPRNVNIFVGRELTSAELAPGVHLWGAACPPEPGYDTPTRVRVDRVGTNLLLLHASIAGQAGSDSRRVYRFGQAVLGGAGFDLALLGHYHNGQVLREGGVQCVYPGSPEPLAPIEAENDHQVVLVTVDDGACRLERIAIDQWRYKVLRVDLSGCSTLEDAGALVSMSLRNAPGGGVDEHTICRVNLIGTKQFQSPLTGLGSRVNTPAHVQFESALRSTAYDLEQLAYEPTSRGLLVRRLQERMAAAVDDSKRSTAMNALTLALKALDGKGVRPNEND